MSCNKFMASNGEPSLLYPALEQKYGEIRALQLWTWANQQQWPDDGKYPNGEPSMVVIEDKMNSTTVAAQLKTIGILQGKNLSKAEGWFKTMKPEAFWPKLQADLQIPKAQIELLKQSDGDTIADKLIDFAAKYSYVIKIDITKNLPSKDLKPSYLNEGEYEDTDTAAVEEFTLNGVYYRNHKLADYPTKGNNYERITEEEFAEAKEKYLNPSYELEPSQHYSNLTVPGGTNYIENEISTPAIIPSIKGHAQFATDNGIGWFRSDDKTVEGTYEEKVSATDGINLSRRDILHTGEATKTRRILEVQSDLFQKGRDNINIEKTGKIISGERGFWYQSKTGEKTNTFISYDEALKTGQELDKNSVGNQFLQLLNKDNNWVTFFIKSIVQDSAKKGYEKILFPTGNTASKVEGHTTLEEFKKQKEDSIKKLESERSKILKVEDEYQTYKESDLDSLLERTETEIAQYKLELARVETEGFGALKPIYKFYEDTVGNILKKQGYNPVVITDEYGNTWNEVDTGNAQSLDIVSFNKQEYESLEFNTPEFSIAPAALEKQLSLTAVRLIGDNGEALGYWDYEKQREVVQSIRYKMLIKYVNVTSDPVVMAKLANENKSVLDHIKEEVRADFNNGLAKLHNIFTNPQSANKRTAGAQNAYTALKAILKVFDGPKGFWQFTIQDLEANKIKFKSDGTPEPVNLAAVKEELEEQGLTDIDYTDGEALQDYFDNSMSLDKKDTASTRIKALLLTIEESKFSTESTLRPIKISMSQETANKVISGNKKDYVLKAEVARRKGLLAPSAVNKGLTLTEQKDSTQGKANLFGTPAMIQTKQVLTEQDLTPEFVARIQKEEGITPEVGDILASIAPYSAANELLQVEKNFLNLARLANYEQLYADLFGLLSDREPNTQAYMQAMLASDNPNIVRTALRLQQAPEHVQNEFTKVMSSHYQRQLMVLIRKSNQGFLEASIIDSNQNNEIKTIQRFWQEAQKESEIFTEQDGEMRIDKDLASGLYSHLQQVLAMDKQSPEYEEEKAKLTKLALEVNGIVLSDNAYKDLRKFEEKGTLGKGTSIRSLIGGGFTEDGKPLGVVEAIISRMNSAVGVDDEADVTADEAFQANNPLYLEPTAMGILARAELPYIQKIYTTTHKDTAGNTIYAYGLNRSLSHAMRKLKTEQSYCDAFKEAPYNSNSWLLNRMEVDPANLDKFQLTYIDGMRNQYGNDKGVSRPDMSDREQWAAMLLYFINNNGKYAHMVSLTHSDKTTSPLFMNAPKLTPDQVFYFHHDNGVIDIHSTAVKLVYDHVFMAEYNRITKSKDPNIKGYNVAKQLFYNLPVFNKDNLKQEVKAGRISQGTYNALWGDDGKINPTTNVGFDKAIKTVIKQELHKMSKETLASFKSSQLMEGNLPGNEYYYKSLLRTVGYYVPEDLQEKNEDKHLLDREHVNSRNQLLTAEVTKEHAATMLAMHYTVNSFLFNASLTQTFFGDPALTFKPGGEDVADGKVKEGREQAVVDATWIEYGKRLAKDIAPGSDVDNSDSPFYTAVTLADYESIAKEMAGVPGWNKPSAGTDAQAMSTMKEFLRQMYKEGKINKSQWDAAQQIMNGANKENDYYYSFEEIPGLHNIILQPSKPVDSGLRPAVEGVMAFDYVKYSMFPLYPPLTKGLELNKLRVAMETQGIDRAFYSSAKKMNAPKVSAKIFDKEGNIDEKAFTSPEWSYSIQQMDRANTRTQQEIPYDEDKKHITIVSQMNKNITEHIGIVQTPFMYKGKETSGKDLREQKENIIKQLVANSHAEFLESIGATMKNNRVTFSDVKKLHKLLAEEIATGAGYSTNDLLTLTSYVGDSNELVVPMYLTPGSSKLESKMFSLIKKIVRIKVPGHSFVQASSAGIKKMSTELPRNGIVWTKGPIENELEMPRQSPTGTIPAQIIVSAQHFKRLTGQDLTDYTIIDENGNKRVDMERMPEGILQMVLARIPNQGHSSMLIAEIAGFATENAGDTMWVPAGITTQMGSDFDVDKLYTYNRLIKETEPNDKLFNDYFDIHWAVLSNPEMYASMMQPLDMDDAKTEADLLSKNNKKYNYLSPSYQLNDFQSMKGAKVLVGQTSLQVVHNAEIQNKQIRITKKQDGLKVATKIVANGLELTHLTGYGRSEFIKPDGTIVKRTKAENLMLQQNESVDHAKNRVVDKINLNPYTSAASLLMSRLQTADINLEGVFVPGESLPFAFNARLLMQPIIREFAAAMAVSNDTLSTTFVSDVKNTVIGELLMKYIKLAKLSEQQVEDGMLDFEFNTTNLLETINMPNNSQEFYARQIAALRLFEKFDTLGTQLISIQSVMSQATRGAGQNMLAALDTAEKLEKINDANADIVFSSVDGLFGNEGETLENDTRTEVGAVYNATVQTAISAFSEALPYRRLSELYRMILEHSGKEIVGLNKEDKNDIFKAVKSYMYASPELGLTRSAEEERIRLMFSDAKRSSLPKRIEAAKKSWGTHNYLLQRLFTDVKVDGNTPDTLEYLAVKAAGNMDQLENEKAWLDMLRSDNDEKRAVGEDLIRWAYITGGLQGTRNFVKFIPWAAIEGSSISTGLRGLSEKLHIIGSSKEAIEQIYQHNPKFAKQLSSTLKELGEPGEIGNNFKLPEYVPDLEWENPAKNLLVLVTMEDGKKRKMYPDYLAYRHPKTYQMMLFAKRGRETYVRIDTLGDKTSGVLEYNGAAKGVAKSIFKQNQVAMPDITLGNFKERVMAEAGMNEFEGGQDLINKMLETIAADKQQPGYLRTVSGLLRDMERNPVEKGLAAATRTLPNLTIMAKEMPLNYNASAAYNQGSNKITLNTRYMGNKTMIAEDLSHELIHYHTALLILATEGEKAWAEMGVDKKLFPIMETMAAYVNSDDALKTKLEALDTIRQHAFDVFEKRVVETIGYERYVNETKKGLGSYAKLHYALSSSREFISHVFTHADTIQFLNTIPYKGKKTVLEHITDILKEVWGSIITSIRGVHSDTVAEEAVARALDVLMYKQKATVDVQNRTAEDFSVMYNDFTSFNYNPFVQQPIEIKKVLGKLQEEKSKLISTQTGINPETQAKISIRIDKLDDQIEKLKSSLDVNHITDVAQEQVNWVKSILTKDEVLANELTVASSIASMWANIASTMFGNAEAGDLSPAMQKIISDATDATKKITVKAIQLQQKLSDGKLTGSDYSETQLTDTNDFEKLLRGANAGSKSGVIQWVSKYITTVQRAEEEEVRRGHITIQALKADMQLYADKKGMKLQDVYGKLMRTDDDSWGLKLRYSQKWFDTRAKLISSRNWELNQIDNGPSDAETPEEFAKEDALKAAHKAMVWAKYWKDIKEIGTFVNTNLFFEPLTGELKTGNEFNAAKADLVKEVGTDHADLIIQRAQEKYLDYVADKRNRETAINEALELEIKRINGLYTGEERDKLVTEAIAKATDEKIDFQNRYSPNVFFNVSKRIRNKSNSAAVEKYIVMSPKQEAKEYWDEGYEEIQQDKELADIYNRYSDMMKEYISFLPKGVQQKVGPGFLAIVRKDLMESSMTFTQYLEGTPDRVVRSLTADQYEEAESKKTYKNIPKAFINEDEAAIPERSKDLIGILDLFAAMATHYKYVAGAKPVVDMSMTILQEINKTRMAGAIQTEQNGRLVSVSTGINNALAALKNLENVLLYKKSKELEMATGLHIYGERLEKGQKISLSPFKQAKIRKDVERLLLEREEVEKKFTYQDAANPYSEADYNKDLKRINDELNKYVGHQVYGSKLTDKLINIAQLKAMSFNPFSAVANVTFGVMSAYIHGAGGMDFTISEFNQAMKMVTKARFDKDESIKIINMMDRMGVVGDYVDSSYGHKKEFRDSKVGWQKHLDPFVLMRKTDFFMKAATTVAIMLHQQVKVADGTSVNVYETLDKDGYWDVAKYGENKAWYSKNLAEETEWNKFRDKTIRLNTVIHGNQDKNSPLLLKKYALGRLIGQFRASWLPEGWASRFQSERYDSELERTIKGRYRTLGGLGIGGSLTVLAKQFVNIIPGVKVDPFTGHTVKTTDKDGNPVVTYLEDSKMDIDNMRRNFAELSFSLAITAMILMIKALNEDDDDKKWQLMILMNMLIRTQQDIDLYASPGVFDTVMRNPIPASDVIKDFGKLISATGQVIIDDDYEWDKWALRFTKAFPYLNHVNRLKYMMEKDLSKVQ